MLSPREVASALHGLKRIVRMDPKGVEFFDNTPEAFWHSFRVAVWVLPVYALENLFGFIQGGADISPIGFSLAKLFAYIIDWVLYPLIMIRVATWLDRWPNYYRYITVYNWFSLVFAAAYLPIVLFGGLGLLPGPLMALLFLGIMGAVLVYSWWIAVHALKVNGATAVGLVLLNTLLSLIISRVISVAVLGGP